MFKTIEVQVKNKVQTVKVFVPANKNEKIIVETYLKNKFARIDPNFKVIG
jgi:hypothetical protein